MKYVRYTGSFVAVDGVIWKTDILQENDTAFSEIGTLSFDADEPVTIEWEQTAKEDVICGSTATIKVISPGDRTYTDLYSVEVGRVQLNIYKDGVLYWVGNIDTELYEEPYESASNYTVSITFSDFGVFDRLKLYGHETYTLKTIVQNALTAAALSDLSIDESLISTSLTADGAAMSLSDLSVSGDNFYDEDGEASNIEDIITGILQPLGLKMIQRGGKVFVFDLNALYSAANSLTVGWSSDSQTLSTDAVYNNVKITYSPYVRNGNLAAEECWELETDENLIQFPTVTERGATVLIDSKVAYYTTFHYDTDIEMWQDNTDAGFTLWTSNTGKNAELLTDGVKFFKIVPQNDGSEAEGISVFNTAMYGFDGGSDITVSLHFDGVRPASLIEQINRNESVTPLWRSEKVSIPAVNDPAELYLRVTLPLLLDARTNPFEEAPEYAKGIRERTYKESWAKYGNFLFVPVLIKYKPDNSETVYVWYNKDVILVQNGIGYKSLDMTLGEWKEYTESDAGAPQRYGYLAYYDVTDRRDNSGVCNGSFTDNRPAINAHNQVITTQLEKIDAGQYIPYPTQGAGTVWLEVLPLDWRAADDSKSALDPEEDLFKAISSNLILINYKTHHILFKLPKFEILYTKQFGSEIEDDEIEYNAELNADAKEELSIDTVCGSVAGGLPTARGAYMNTETGEQITELTRGGRTTQIENLLIGTLYSQYATRHISLSGEAYLPDVSNGILPFVEDNQDGKKFIMVQSIENLREGVTDAVFIELSKDEYVEKE